MAATQDVARASLYRGVINLWVEDLNGAVRTDLTELRQALHRRIERQKTVDVR
jgi:hypothetical protein